MRRRGAWVLALALSALVAGCGGRPEPQSLASWPVAHDGSAAGGPAGLPEGGGGRYELVVTGRFTGAADGLTRDAVYTFPRPGEGSPREHGLLRLSPPELMLVESDPVRHRYVYQVPETSPLGPSTWQVSLALDRLALELGVDRPGGVSAIEGGLRAEVIDLRPDPQTLRERLARTWACWVCLGPVCVAIAASLLLAVGQSRRDVARRLRALEGRCRSATRAAESAGEGSGALVASLGELRKLAYRIVAYIEQTRLAEQGRTRSGAARAVGRLQERLAATHDEEERARIEEGLEGERAALAALETLAARREAAFADLDAVEALLRDLEARMAAAEPAAEPAELRGDVERLAARLSERYAEATGPRGADEGNRGGGRPAPPGGETLGDS